jgi:hypothetical protein
MIFYFYGLLLFCSALDGEKEFKTVGSAAAAMNRALVDAEKNKKDNLEDENDVFDPVVD